ncbi:hypothetical protein CPJCM30710_20960 [Clostridium polyendosporum]|uniref:N-acetyltransferase domain-containing protein n=1 Tax=Clostridium polyendosporum TaxID=69208 RepID=A0A919VGI6_9CLOT|nr:GNAT family N-acetyltransferase [Clostridium polyendosporum]GIM29430.1 hypothetical protein CPJCM30710_20960 [Clostridium polyendosporum]
MKVKVRKTKSNDFGMIAELIYSTEPFPQVIWGKGKKEQILERILELLEDEDNRYSSKLVMVAELNDRVVGMILLIPYVELRRLSKNTDKILLKYQHKDFRKRFIEYKELSYNLEEAEREELYISNIAVFDEFRGKGIGRALFEKAEEEAYLIGFDKLSLTTKDEKVIKYYISEGFTIEQVMKLEDKNLYRMVKEL